MKQWMKAGAGLLMAALLAGCGTFIRSNVTAFHEWPAQLPQKSYVFERSKEQDASLEYRSYENLVRAELNKLGFVEAGPNVPPYLKVKFQTAIDVRDVREVYSVVQNYPYYGSTIGAHAFYGPAYPFYGPFYGPLYHPWYSVPVVQEQETSYQLYTRRLNLSIARYPDGPALYQSSLVSEGRNGSLANVMPYLVRSMFKDFPGPSGVTRQVELKME